MTKKDIFFNPIPSEVKKPVVVLDIQNIALKYGDNKVFACKGIQIAVTFFKVMGFKIMSFAPDYILDSDTVVKAKRAEVSVIVEPKFSPKSFQDA